MDNSSNNLVLWWWLAYIIAGTIVFIVGEEIGKRRERKTWIRRARLWGKDWY